LALVFHKKAQEEKGGEKRSYFGNYFPPNYKTAPQFPCLGGRGSKQNRTETHLTKTTVKKTRAWGRGSSISKCSQAKETRGWQTKKSKRANVSFVGGANRAERRCGGGQGGGRTTISSLQGVKDRTEKTKFEKRKREKKPGRKKKEAVPHWLKTWKYERRGPQ